jgi:tetratricopeptide (TPR) repeat protein
MRHRGDYLLVRTLLRAQAAQLTGSLTVVGEGVTTIIRLRHGRPVFTEGGLPADSMGRALVRRGVLTEAEHADVVAERMASQGRLRFGDMAVQLGILDPDVVRDALLEQVRDKVLRCLSWERSEHQLVTGGHDREALGNDSLELEPLILRAVRRHFSASRVEDVLAPAWANRVEFAQPVEVLAARFLLDEEDIQRLRDIPQIPTVGVILAGPGPLSRSPHAAQLLCALALCDQLSMPELEAPEESGAFLLEDFTMDFRESDPRAVEDDDDPVQGSPGAANDASGAGRDVGKTPFDRPLPRTPAEPLREDPPTGKVVARVQLKRRSRPSIREVAAPGVEHRNRHKLLADSAFLQGKEMLRTGEFSAAADALTTASELRPGAREYRLFAAWAAYLASGRSEEKRTSLRQLCEDALEQDGQLAFAHHVRGQLALADRDHDTARSAFRRAVELDPRDTDAIRVLERIG